MSDQPPFTARMAPAIGAIPQDQWDALAGADNPFVSHAFLTSLEDSQSVGIGTGWIPLPLVIEDENGQLLAAMPSYTKAHSQGEFVFDYAWADAWQRAGGHYYPKLQISVPFTPATGPRLLVRDPAYAELLLRAAEAVCLQNDFSSAHATFIEPEQLTLFREAGWMLRSDLQFHWENRGYSSFDDFLNALTSRKRKAMRKERRQAQEGVMIKTLTGDDIKPEHWDAFWEFYQDTGQRKWGTPYLTREAFDLFGERMGDRVLLIFAYMDGTPIAGALNFIGGKALYGRYWGCVLDKPFLHFELCYYQAIDAAIELGLDRVEAGAQGGHKLARGYEPVRTWSAHWIADPGFREAVSDFLEKERHGVQADQLILERRQPFKKG